MGDFVPAVWRAPRCPECRSSAQVELCNDEDCPWACLSCMIGFHPGRRACEDVHDQEKRV